MNIKITVQKLTKFIGIYYSILLKGFTEELADKLNAELKKLDLHLADKSYVGGDSFNYSDILVFPHLERVLWFEGSVMDEVFAVAKLGEFKNIKAYYERVLEYPDLKPVLCVPKAH